MTGEVKILPISKLKTHEEITEGRLQKLMRDLKKDGVLWFPILVDKDDYIVLDGHNRVEAFKRMGLKKILCRLVDYDDPKIKVHPRRKHIPITKDIVREKVRAGEIFPHKTTKHVYPHKTKHYDEPLESFK